MVRRLRSDMTASAQSIKLITRYARLEKASQILLLAVFYTLPISDIKSRVSTLEYGFYNITFVKDRIRS